MKRLSFLLGVLSLCVGCASEGEKDPWEDFKKDLRGDNMQMRNHFSGMDQGDDSPAKAKSRE